MLGLNHQPAGPQCIKGSYLAHEACSILKFELFLLFGCGGIFSTYNTQISNSSGLCTSIYSNAYPHYICGKDMSFWRSILRYDEKVRWLKKFSGFLNRNLTLPFFTFLTGFLTEFSTGFLTGFYTGFLTGFCSGFFTGFLNLMFVSLAGVGWVQISEPQPPPLSPFSPRLSSNWPLTHIFGILKLNMWKFPFHEIER